jgi:type I restriction enzyme S subunit
MEVKPGYKQTELGMIPEAWEVKEMSALLEQSRDIRYGIVQPGKYDPRGCLMLRSQDYSKDWANPDDMHRVNSLLENQYRNARIRSFDLIMTIVGAGIGHVVVAPSWLDGAILSRSTARIAIDKNQAASPFIGAFLESPLGKRQILNCQKEGAQPVVSCRDLAQFLVPYPPLREQCAIAGALCDVDALIESLEQLIAKKRQIKQGAMQELLTGKKRLPGFTGEWKVKALDELFGFSGGFSASRDQLSSAGYCYLHYGDIHKSQKSFIDVRSEYQDIPKLDIPLKRVSRASLLDDGDVVFVDASEDDEGTSRHVVIINRDHRPFISGLHTIVAKQKSSELNHEFRRYCFQTKDIKNQFHFFAVGTKVLGISKTNIVKITLPVSSPHEQAAIAAFLSDMDAEITALEEKLTKTRTIKQGMMQELLTGRVRLV